MQQRVVRAPQFPAMHTVVRTEIQGPVERFEIPRAGRGTAGINLRRFAVAPLRPIRVGHDPWRERERGRRREGEGGEGERRRG